MTDGEKMVWAAAFALAMSGDYDARKASDVAEDAVVALRNYARSESMVSSHLRSTCGFLAERMTK